LTAFFHHNDLIGFKSDLNTCIHFIGGFLTCIKSSLVDCMDLPAILLALQGIKLPSSNTENTLHHFLSNAFHHLINDGIIVASSIHFHTLYNDFHTTVDTADSGLPVVDEIICCRF